MSPLRGARSKRVPGASKYRFKGFGRYQVVISGGVSQIYFLLRDVQNA